MQASEIIVNPDKSIYHLKLKNGEVPRKVITVGDPDRVALVAKYLDSIYWERQNREFHLISGRIANEDILIISTGIGTDNIDIVLNELQLAYAWDLEKREPFATIPAPLQIIRLGTSGALHADIALDSILISKAALGFDGLMYFYENNFDFPDLGFPDFPKPYLAEADPVLLKRFSAIADNEGTTVTANGFYGPQGRSIISPTKNRDFIKDLASMQIKTGRITNLEMDTAGIYALGSLLNMQCISLSAILANRLLGTFSIKPEQTTQRLIESALQLLSEPH
jgi:uridine phosphorylase